MSGTPQKCFFLCIYTFSNLFLIVESFWAFNEPKICALGHISGTMIPQSYVSATFWLIYVSFPFVWCPVEPFMLHPLASVASRHNLSGSLLSLLLWVMLGLSICIVKFLFCPFHFLFCPVHYQPLVSPTFALLTSPYHTYKITLKHTLKNFKLVRSNQLSS